jgi:hypothetical protein
MEELIIKDIINQNLFETFAKLKGKYLFYSDKEEGKIFFIYFIKDVMMKEKIAKMKLSRYDFEKDEFHDLYFSAITHFRNKWQIMDKEEFTKFLVIHNLK